LYVVTEIGSFRKPEKQRRQVNLGNISTPSTVMRFRKEVYPVIVKKKTSCPRHRFRSVIPIHTKTTDSIETFENIFTRKHYNRHLRMRQIDAPDRCEVCCISKKCRYFQSKLSRSPFTKEIRDKLKSIDNQNWKTWL